MKYKVKYTRKEYREEYLNSEEWKTLRKTILDSCPECQCCGKSATDVHHIVYRNLVDVKVTDLLPVCRSCHETIHEAINYDWISQNPKDLEEIKRKTLKINFDDSYIEYLKWMKEKHLLSQQERDSIKELQGFIIQKISALVRKNVWYDKLDHMKFTGKQILQIRKIIQLGIYRRKEKLDVKKKTILKKRKYSFNGKQK